MAPTATGALPLPVTSATVVHGRRHGSSGVLSLGTVARREPCGAFDAKNA